MYSSRTLLSLLPTVPVNWDTTYQGKYWAQPSGKGLYDLGKTQRVFSYRLTWVPADGPPINRPDLKGKQQAGVKLVLWPLYDMDKQLGTIDEFSCQPGWKYKIDDLPNPQQAKLGCVSPVDRIYCLTYDDPIGIVDSLTPVDFAGDVGGSLLSLLSTPSSLSLPSLLSLLSLSPLSPLSLLYLSSLSQVIPKDYDFSNQIQCQNPTDANCRAVNKYPMGSGRLAPYADSWNGGVCMANPSHNQLIGPG